MSGGQETLTYRVAQLEKNYDRLDTKMDAILQNHLPHIQKEITKQTTRINVLTVVNVGAIVTYAIIQQLF